MQFIRSFIVPAALLASNTALADDSWSIVEGEEVVYEEVGDGVFMPVGLLDSLPNADQLVGLLEEEVQAAEKGIEVRERKDNILVHGGNGRMMACTTVTTTVEFGTVTVSKSTMSCKAI